MNTASTKKRPTVLWVFEQLAQWVLFGASTYFSVRMWTTLAGDDPWNRWAFIAAVSCVQAVTITFWILGASKRKVSAVALSCALFSLLGPVLESMSLVTETTKRVEAASFFGDRQERALADAETELATQLAYLKTITERIGAMPITQSSSALRAEKEDIEEKIQQLRDLIGEIERDLGSEKERTVVGAGATVTAVEKVAVFFGVSPAVFSMWLLILRAVMAELGMMALAWIINAPPKKRANLLERKKFVQISQALHAVGVDGKTLCGYDVPANAKPTTEPVGFMCAKCFALALEADNGK